jgi:Tfp pilus assembly PilM family ATPase
MFEAVRSKITPLKRLDLQRLRTKFRVRRAGQITALDVDGSILRVVQAGTRANRPAVTRVDAAPLDLPPDADRQNPEVLGKAIRATLDSLRLKPALVVMGVPRAQVVLRTLSLPVVEDFRELASMVHLQVAKDLPFRMDDAVIDFRVRPQGPKAATGVEPARPESADTPDAVPAPAPRLEALVAVAKRDVVDFYRQVAAAAGVKLAALGLLSYGNARCLEACRVADDDQGVALVSLRPDEVNIDVIVRQSLRFSRGAAVKPGASDNEPAVAVPEPPATPANPSAEPASSTETVPVSGPLNFVEAVTIEVVRSLHGYGGMEPNHPVMQLAVAGATGQEEAVVEALQKRLSLPCALLDLARALQLPAADRQHLPGAMAPIGLALGITDAPGLPFDFLHPKRPAVQRDLRRVRLLMGAAAAVVLLTCVLAVRWRLLEHRRVVQRQLQEELSAAGKMQRLYRQGIAQHAAIRSWVNEGQNWLAHYAYLSSILPRSEEIVVTSLTVGGPDLLRLSVQARSGEILARLDKQLRAAGYEVKPQAITPGADKHGYDFRSSVELLIPPKMKIDLSKLRPPPKRPADDASLDAARPSAALRREAAAALAASATPGGRR